MMEFLASHTAVVFQPEFDDPRFSGFNPYALGFEMMCDIERMALRPSTEDRERLPDIAATSEPDRLRSTFINGIKHLRCEFTPVAVPR